MKTRETIALNLIDDNPWQPRVEIEPITLGELADSIHQIGLLQAPAGRRLPCPHQWVGNLARRMCRNCNKEPLDCCEGCGACRDCEQPMTGAGSSPGRRVQLAFGHRRVAAGRLLHERGDGPAEIEMDVDDYTDEQMAVMALSENVARRQLTQIEVVLAHRRALDETELSIQGLADKLGVSRSALSNNLRVLELPDFVLAHVESGALRVSVAREFLVLQNADHAHTADMQAVINSITNNYRVKHEGALPNWSRRNVRKEIYERVANNEQDFRPLGPRVAGVGGVYSAGDTRETNFDVEAFTAERPDTLHTIPARGTDKSRVWTCDVREWRRRQTQATREANKEAAASGRKTNAAGSSRPSRDKQFENMLAQDPVFMRIKAARAKNGPDRPVSDEEREHLGTRAELRTVDPYGDAFWKSLQNGRAESIWDWERDRKGGRVPPFFDLSECNSCIAGAAYAKPRHDHTGQGVRLVCTNRACYDRKVAAYEAVHIEKVEDGLKETDREDGEMIRAIMVRLSPLTFQDLRTLASSLIAAQPELELTHTMGEPHKKWSFTIRGPVKFITGLLAHQPPHFDRFGRREAGRAVLNLESLDAVPDDDLLELTATLMTYHLGQACKIDSVSQETVSVTDPMEVRAMLTGEQATTEVRT